MFFEEGPGSWENTQDEQPHALGWRQEVVSAGGTVLEDDLEWSERRGRAFQAQEVLGPRCEGAGEFGEVQGLSVLGTDCEGRVRGREQEPGWDKQGSGCEGPGIFYQCASWFGFHPRVWEATANF